MEFEVHLVEPPMALYSRRNTHLLEYDPLPTPTSIRLLKIDRLEHVRDNIDLYRPIHCSLVTQDLNDICQYDALSYTWGDPLGRSTGSKEGTPDCGGWSAPAFTISCGDKHIRVTTNLHSALLVLRYYHTLAVDLDFPKLSDCVWIDQICIDQTNIAERNAQVGLMGRIYRQARSTQVWLGGNDQCANDFQYVSDCLAPLDYENPSLYRSFNILQRHSYEALGIRPISPERWRGAYNSPQVKLQLPEALPRLRRLYFGCHHDWDAMCQAVWPLVILAARSTPEHEGECDGSQPVLLVAYLSH